MQTVLRGLCGILIACLLSTSCGSSGQASGQCTGVALTDTQLCKLKCGQTTPGGAKELLGTPSASTSSGATTLTQYTKTCLAGSNASGTTWGLYFMDGLLTNVTVTAVGDNAGAMVPQCLADCRP